MSLKSLETKLGYTFKSLKLLESIKEPGTIIDSPFRWKRDRFEEMADGISLTEGEQVAIRN